MSSPDEEKRTKLEAPTSPDIDDEDHGYDNEDGLQRRLNNRQIQLIAIGGSIGTALFVSIGSGLIAGGPGSLFIAYTFYPMVLGLVNNSLAEMTVYQPVSGGFVRLAGHYVDEAFGFLAGWNFFLYEALLIPFEITALNLVISFWSDKVTDPGPTAGICAAVIICYAAINILAVRGYGEAEFWLSGGKVILILMLFAYTFVTMVGGNPKGWAYGFTYWQNPGAFAEYPKKGEPYYVGGSLGKFEGFLKALFNAAFAVVGPEYISMVAAEAKRPRKYIKTAFMTVYWRFFIFFFGSGLAVGIVIAYNDPTLVAQSSAGESSASASPYVIAMQNLGVSGLPHLVNALMLTSIFSAGNTYTYAATRSLYGLALEGRAPAILRKTTAKGVPIYCFAVVMCFPLLSFLQVSKGSAQVLTWLVSLTTAGGLIDYIIMSTTFIFYYKACLAQNFDRRALPYYGRFQPYGAYIALSIHVLIVIFYGFSAFQPPSAETFFQNYTMQIIAVILFFGWKFIHKTRVLKPHEVDLVWEAPAIDRYENSFTSPPIGFWTEMLRLIGINRKKTAHQADE